jgi:hypothetical protein
VILADGFESYTSASQLTTLGPWDGAGRLANLRIATEPGNHFGGHKALEMTLNISQNEQGVGATKNLNPEEPVLYVRTYAKFDLGFTINGASHNGIRISGHYPFNPCTGTPHDGTGWFVFTLQNNRSRTGRAGENQPGFGQLYAYWPLQRSDCGDHWFSDGFVIPYSPVIGNKGEWLAYPAQYPDFVPIPNWQPIRGVWYCYEFMVKVNDLDRRNGEVAYWINGELKGRFTNLFLRSVDSLKVNDAGLLLHALHSERVNKKWYDNVVIARSYIGPISPLSRFLG